jgi:hypothetical protein
MPSASSKGKRVQRPVDRRSIPSATTRGVPLLYKRCDFAATDIVAAAHPGGR